MDEEPMTCREFTIVDRRGRQRFHFTSTKPPILLADAEVPAAQRATPDSASYLVFNDEHGDERGGPIASANRISLSLDYSNCDALGLFVDMNASGRCAPNQGVILSRSRSNHLTSLCRWHHFVSGPSYGRSCRAIRRTA
jgi:hypothetical protein